LEITIWFKSSDLEEVKKVCSDIAARDGSFKFKIDEEVWKEKICLSVFSKDKDVAHKRGLWLTNRVPELKNCGYNCY